jgi:hypothetical protein
MKKNTALKTAGCVFLLGALAHVARLYLDVQITIGNHIVPIWGSYIGLAITLILAWWMFKATRGKN